MSWMLPTTTNTLLDALQNTCYNTNLTTLRKGRDRALPLTTSAEAELYGPVSDRRSRSSHWHAECSMKRQRTICEFLPTGRAQSVQLSYVLTFE